jgi:hypothetical protein
VRSTSGLAQSKADSWTLLRAHGKTRALRARLTASHHLAYTLQDDVLSRYLTDSLSLVDKSVRAPPPQNSMRFSPTVSRAEQQRGEGWERVSTPGSPDERHLP